MNIEYIEDFIKVAEYQSLNQASKLLNISTPALSKRIKRVEEYFESDLFYRTSRGIFLTEHGELVLSKVKIIKSDIDELKAETSKNGDATIRVGLLPSFSLYKWAEQKETLINQKISIKIESNTQILLDHLHNGDIDVIIGDITATENNQLYSEVLYRAIDAEGHTLDIWLRKQRDNHSAYAFIKRLIKQFGKPQKVVTDQAPSTKVAMAKVIKAFKLKPDCHCTSKYLNNLIEQDHRHIKVRKTSYQSINTAKNTLKGIECIYALYKKNRRSLQIYGFSPCHEISIMLAS
ncbi:hypothetical protein BU055_06600 [Staphylococcus succinus]|nr:hypothetical protein BU055_06600 [Staphylococcus succinus]